MKRMKSDPDMLEETENRVTIRGAAMKRKELTGIFVCFALLFFAAYVFAAPVPDTAVKF